MRPLGIILLLIGAALLFVSCNMITSVSGYHNVGLISDRQTITITAATIAITGLLIYLFNPRKQTQIKPTKKCPFCAEKILLEASICKHCHSEIAASHRINITRQTNGNDTQAANKSDQTNTTSADNKIQKEPQLHNTRPIDQLNRAKLNSSLDTRLETTKTEAQIRTIVAEEMSKIATDFNKETLTQSKHNLVSIEATLQKLHDTTYLISVRYSTHENFLPIVTSAIILFMYATRPQVPQLFYAALLSTSITTWIYIKTKRTTNKIRTAVNNIKSLAESK